MDIDQILALPGVYCVCEMRHGKVREHRGEILMDDQKLEIVKNLPN